VAWSLVRSL